MSAEVSQALVVVMLGGLLLIGLLALLRRPQPVPEPTNAGRWEDRINLSDRLSRVENAVEGLRGEIGSIRDAVKRTEKMTDLVMEHLLEADKK